MSDNEQKDENREKLADIVAEMRNETIDHADCICFCEDGSIDLSRLADRIEAAADREREAVEADALSVGGVVEAARHKPVGNTASIREALSKIYKLMTSDCPADEVEIANICFQFLSAPARNCDRFEDAKTARQAWLDDANNWDEFGSPKLELPEWLFASAKKKGENDGIK